MRNLAATMFLVFVGTIAAFAAPPNTTQPNLQGMLLSQCIQNAIIVGGGTGSGPVCYGVVTGTDGNLNIASTTNVELTPSSLSAARTWTLPSASSYGKGNALFVADPAGAINGTDTITLSHAGSDTINGNTTFVVNTQYAVTELISDGVSKWVVPVASGTGTVTQVNTAGGLTGGPITSSGTILTPGGLINKFHNGPFDVWQRGISALSTSTSITSASAYTADGWQVQPSGATVTCAQATGNTGNNTPLYALSCTGQSSNTDTIIFQRLESSIAAPLASQIVTVQFQYKQNTGSSITPKLVTCYPSTADTWDSGTNKANCANNSNATTDLSSTSLSSCATATWCIESYTLTVSGSATKGYEVDFDCNTALSAAQACEITAADIRVTPGVSTGVNTSPPPPELRPVIAELASCQRYYETGFGNGVTPANSTSAYMEVTGLWPSANTVISPWITFAVQKRATPSLTFYSPNLGSPTNGDWSYLSGATWTPGTTISVQANVTGFGVQVVGTMTAGTAYPLTGQWAASDEL